MIIIYKPFIYPLSYSTEQAVYRIIAADLEKDTLKIHISKKLPSGIWLVTETRTSKLSAVLEFFAKGEFVYVEESELL